MTKVSAGFTQFFDFHMLEVARGASRAFGLRVLGAGLGFLLNLLLARLLGAGDLGVYFLAITLITVGSVLGRLGLDNTLLRSIASFASAGSWVSVWAVYRSGMRLALFASAALAILISFLAEWISSTIFDKPEMASALRVMAFGLPAFSLMNLQAECLRGIKAVGRSTMVQGLVLPLLQILFLIALAYILPGHSMTVLVAALILTLAINLDFLLGLKLWLSAVPKACEQTIIKRWQLLKTSQHFYAISCMNMIIWGSSTILLGIWMNAHDVGLYGVALRITTLNEFILNAVNSISAPKFAALYSEKRMGELSQLARRSAALMTLLSAPLLLTLIVFSKVVLRIFGADFVNASSCLIVLSLGQFVNVVTGSVGYLLLMTGHERLVRNNVLFCSLLNLVLNYSLIHLYGIVGAAVATAVTVALGNLTLAYCVYAKLEIITIPLLARGVSRSGSVGT